MRCAIVGAGNVASHLAKALHERGVRIECVVARHRESAKRLAEEVDSLCATDDIAAVPADVDFVLISVNDSTVADVASRLPEGDYLMMHTSGSVPLNVLSERHCSAAVLYPLQTFSRDVAVDLRQVPFFTEATDTRSLERADEIARMMSDTVYHADSAQRKYLHIAGVLSSNFTVYLLEQCRRVLEPAGFPLQVVKPLTEATIAKAFAVGPHDAMTGPARRGDLGVAEAHAAALPEDVAEVYRAITKQIYNTYHECDKL